MSTQNLPKWVSDLIDKGESASSCLELLREMRTAEREERAAEREMRKVEMDREVKLKELELKEKELSQGGTHTPKSDNLKSKLPKFQEGQDPDVFLKSFEKLVSLHKIQKPEWPLRLVPLLCGKALEAYSRLSEEDGKQYDKIKTAILTRYELTSDAYRDKFRNSSQLVGESFREFSVRLEGFLRHWCERESIGGNYEKFYDLIIREQLMLSSDRDLRLWIQEHKPESVNALVQLAEAYQTAHKNLSRGNIKLQPGNEAQKKIQNKVGNPSQYKRDDRTCFMCKRQGHIATTCPLRRQQFRFPDNSKQGKLGLCMDKQDDIYPDHPVDGYVGGLTVRLPGISCDEQTECKKVPGLEIVEGKVNGNIVSVLRDTGSSTVFVNSKFVEPDNFTGKSRDICLADGSTRNCREAWIDVTTPFISGTVLALVLNTPFADLIIGNYVNTSVPPSAIDSVVNDANVETTNVSVPDLATEPCNAVQTRAQKRQQSDETAKTELNAERYRDDCTLTETLQVSNTDNNFKICSRQELIEAQKEDHSLDKLRNFVSDESQEPSYFTFKSDLLYRIFKTGSGEIINQIVVPRQYRKTVLTLGHDIPLAGHLGTKKTRDRIMQHFFWPGMFQDISEFCRSCPECQKGIQKGRIPRAPLISIPPIDEPFQRIAIDFVGPLPLTENKNRYILVCIDYATRYPEAFPLRNQEAETVADALVNLFSRVGVARELLTDQGSNFMSDLMKQVCKLLTVNKICTTPYHPAANGLVENFNGVLKKMLKSYAQKQPSNWDKYIPYILFAYREVPNESTGFSPFELLYGRHIRGPLAILKEEWEEPTESDNSVLSYLLETREKLKLMSDLARMNEKEAKQKQKTYYDKRARSRNFEVGQKVLVLLPTNTSKLLASWKGPYLITDKVSPVDYKIRLRGNVEKIFHVNMLKLWHERTDDSYSGKQEILACLEVISGLSTDDDQSDVDFNVKITPGIEGKETVDDVTISEQLSLEQQQQLKELLGEYTDIFSDVPQVTDIIQHTVKTTTEEPIYKKPYPVPYALRDQVKEEVDKMLKAGIIEPSNSPYAAPVVLVRKKDSSIRFCIDYRDLNKITIFDPRPMPRMDEILNKISKAKYITKLDMAKGYWQVPLDNDAKRKSAFVTPFGQFQFTVMPFGMVNSGATFVRLMNKVLAGHEEYADSFIDDVGIFSDSWAYHLEHLRLVFQLIRDAKLTARPSKCSLGFAELEFLGHIVGNGVIKPVQDKVTAIQEYPVPKTKKNVRSFLGLIGFYRKFIPRFSEVAVPLTDLTKKNLPNKVNWLDSHQKCFDQLKGEICKDSVLRSPDFHLKFILQTDASQSGLGAVLEQEFRDGRHPVMFLSKKLNGAERNYAVIEKECYAIVWAVKTLKVYLEGKEFTINCDHSPLQWLDRVKTSNQRLLRWSLMLQEYKFTISYIAGKRNIVADALSRSDENCDP